MKKLIFTLCALCLCGTMWAADYDETTGLYYDEVTYTVSNVDYTVIAIVASEGEDYTIANLVENSDGTYTLPATVGDNIAVEAVDANAFSGKLTNTNTPIHLVVPANINYLGQMAFGNCTQIEEVTLEYSESDLHELYNNANGNSFYGCSGIKTVHMNREVSLARGDSQSNHNYLIAPFSQVKSIETIYIGEHVSSIVYNMFNCNDYSNSFANCKLKDVYCYATSMVPTISYGSFGQHTGLTLHAYDALLTAFEEDHATYQDGWGDTSGGWGDIFSTFEGLGSPDLEEGTYQDVTTGLYFEINEDETTASIYHDENGLYDNSFLVKVEGQTDTYTLPATVQAEEGGTEYAVTRVEASAFAGSSISGHLIIPANIVNMGESAFQNCTGLTEVTYEYSSTALTEENQQNSNGAGCSFQGCSNVTTVNLYRNLSQTGSYQFRAPFCCHTSVVTLNIGPHVTTILPYMFRCTSGTPLKNINVYSINPPTLSSYDPFANLNSEYVINVPFGAESLYTDASSSWATFATDGHIAELDNAFAITTHDNNDGTAYATFYNSASDVELFDDGTETKLTAYVAYQLDEESDGLYIEIESIGNVVPAGTGVIVETEEAGTYLAIATSNGESYTGSNDLYGYDEAQPITNPGEGYLYYLLSSYNGQVGFYWGEEDGAAFTCQAHKAYLALSSTAVTNATHISIRKGNGGDDTTGISSVESATEGATVKGIYTVQGVRVSNMNQPGLYIVDGHKVLVK